MCTLQPSAVRLARGGGSPRGVRGPHPLPPTRSVGQDAHSEGDISAKGKLHHAAEVEDEDEDAWQVVNAEGQQPVYAVISSAKASSRRLHVWHGCWRVNNEAVCEPIWDLQATQFDGVCGLCWPKGSRPLRGRADALRALQMQADEPGLPSRRDEASSSESSSSSVSRAAADPPEEEAEVEE